MSAVDLWNAMLIVVRHIAGNRIAHMMPSHGWATSTDPSWIGGRDEDWDALFPRAKDAQIRAWKLLTEMLNSAEIAGVGLHYPDDTPGPISPAQWQNLRADIGSSQLMVIQPNPPSLYPPVKHVRVEPADVLRSIRKRCPAGPAGAPSKRGPRPTQTPRVKDEMRAFRDRGGDLASMKQEEMAAQFHAAPSTCRQARKAVLAGDN